MTLEKVDMLLEIKKKYEELVPKYEALKKEKEEFNDTAETSFEKYLDNFLNYLEIPIPPTSNNFEDN
ncbi:14429_t:CDS:1, partial [Dentiscutata erythropus]